MSRLERHIVQQGLSDDGNRSITLLRSYRNFQTWYDIEIDRWINGQVEVYVKNCLDCDQAFDFFDKYIERHNLKVRKG